MQDAVAEGRFSSAVRVEAELPAPAMDGDLVVEDAEQAAVREASRPAAGKRDEVMHLTSCGWLVAAGEGAVLVASDDGAAQVRRDGVGGPAEVEREADAGGGLR